MKEWIETIEKEVAIQREKDLILKEKCKGMSTKALSELLVQREGIEVIEVAPYEKYEIKTETASIIADGPVHIIINGD